MKIGDILYEDFSTEGRESFEAAQLEMALVCEKNGWCMEDGYDENGRRFLIINPPVKQSQEEIETALQKQYIRLIQSILDKEAYALGYTGPGEAVEGSCMSVCSYVETGVQKFDDEGKSFRAWRSAVWAMGYEILDAVKAGEMAIPTEEKLVEMLPKLEIIYTE